MIINDQYYFYNIFFSHLDYIFAILQISVSSFTKNCLCVIFEGDLDVSVTVSI